MTTCFRRICHRRSFVLTLLIDNFLLQHVWHLLSNKICVFATSQGTNLDFSRWTFDLLLLNTFVQMRFMLLRSFSQPQILTTGMEHHKHSLLFYSCNTGLTRINRFLKVGRQICKTVVVGIQPLLYKHNIFLLPHRWNEVGLTVCSFFETLRTSLVLKSALHTSTLETVYSSSTISKASINILLSRRSLIDSWPQLHPLSGYCWTLNGHRSLLCLKVFSCIH